MLLIVVFLLPGVGHFTKTGDEAKKGDAFVEDIAMLSLKILTIRTLLLTRRAILGQAEHGRTGCDAVRPLQTVPHPHKEEPSVMRILARTLPALLLCAFLFHASEARADTIVITSGFARSIDPIGVAAGNFSFAGQNLSVSGNTDRHRFGYDGLLRGDSITRGVATVNGATYSAYYFGTELSFQRAPIVLPPPGLQTITITTPFTMTGTLLIREGSMTAPIFSLSLSGQGIASITFQLLFLEGGFAYVPTDVRYDFQPAAVPEPATLMLLGTGLAGVAAGIRKRRKSARLDGNAENA